ncbi:uncharacterized protein [Watersipora subatra]|uniref:uncharacterized protein n=1 Tax=Watersipora subatra TaxID=2589382 RepID=UPI00355AE7C7
MFSSEKNISVLTAQRLQRWALTLMAYQYDIRDKPTAQHGNADGVSRLPIGAGPKFDHDEEKESIEVSHTIQEELDHGLPRTIVTDNGTQFVSNEVDQFCTMHDIKHITSPAFHPADGMRKMFVV